MKALKIILLFDLLVELKPEEYDDYWQDPDWKPERDIKRTLTKLGHDVIPIGIHNDIEPLLAAVREHKPDLVFNMIEAFGGNRDHEPNMAALMQLIGVPFTGTGPQGLHLCKDKALTKMVLGHHQIRTPMFAVAAKSRALPSLKDFAFPAIVKPLQMEASEGISQSSYVENEADALERVKFIHERYGADAIVEEYIQGRELYVGVIGNEKLVAFPPREMFFKEIPDDEPKIATYRSKWDQGYRKKWGIDSGWAASLPEPTQKKLSETCKKIYRLLHIQGYGRIDLRLREDGEIYFIEANPNPSIAKKEDYAMSAGKGGLEYDELIAKIVSLALAA